MSERTLPVTCGECGLAAEVGLASRNEMEIAIEDWQLPRCEFVEEFGEDGRIIIPELCPHLRHAIRDRMGVGR